MPVVVVTVSAEETVELGRRVGAGLRPGDVVAFFGDLGAGKTTMIKGIALALGVSDVVRSPSFVVVTEYQGVMRVQHIDLYRLKDPSELDGIGFTDLFAPDCVTLIEWADRAGLELPVSSIRVEIAVGDADRRSIGITGLRDGGEFVSSS